MAAYNAALLAPLVEELSATRATLVAQAETIGRLTAELEALKAVQARPVGSHAVDAEPAPDPFPQPIPPSPNAAPWWRRWMPWLASAGLVVVVTGVNCRPW